jgi:transposase-like protein
LSRGGPPAEWLELARYARDHGIPERTLRRRLTALHQRQGGGVLRSYNEAGTRVGKWFFSPLALQAALEREPDETEAALGEHTLELEDLKRKVEALRQSLNAVKAKMKTTKPEVRP